MWRSLVVGSGLTLVGFVIGSILYIIFEIVRTLLYWAQTAKKE